MSSSLLESVLSVLKQDSRLVSEDGDLLKNKAQELAYKLDPAIIGLLLKDSLTKAKFFQEIDGCLIFDQDAFVSFVMSKEFLPDSYTSYRNKIGLTIDGKSLDERKEVSLVWAYKDCVLAGGQDKEDSKRDEIFYNETLGSDQIDRLLDTKVFTEFKRINKDGKHNLEAFRKNENGDIQDNLIIKGNNLLALHSLKKRFKGKVKLIYIDPPYNTGWNWDTFAYNNRFKHSTWLTFMKNRLEVAKQLLTKDGSIVVAIDKAEQVYLWVLLDEVFPEHESHCVTIVHNPRGVQGTNFSYTHEFAFFVIPKDKKTILNRRIEEDDIKIRGLRDNWGESERKDAKNCFYSIIADKRTLRVIDFWDVCPDSLHPQGNINDCDFVEIYPIDKEWIERKWRYARQSIEEVKDLLHVKIKNGVYDIDIWKDFWQYKTVWVDKRYDANEYGTKLIKDLVPWCKFSFPKSLWNVYDCLYAIVNDDKDALVLDFFGGSGTTAHAVLELNKDGWDRKFILVDQMDYVDHITSERVRAVIKNEGKWDFVYMEIACNAERYIEMIRDAGSTNMLLEIWEELKTKSFVNHKLDPKSIDNMIDEFKALTLTEQQKILIDLIDKNALYKNFSEMEAVDSGVSEEDKKLNRDFYNL